MCLPLQSNLNITSTPPPPSDSGGGSGDSGKKGVSGGAIAGIVLGLLAGAVIIWGLLYYARMDHTQVSNVS